MFKKRETNSRQTLNILNNSQKNSQFDFAEVFRHIRTNIEFSTIGSEVKAISITSTQAGEAKSTTAINLAYMFATKYEKVLIIDCDLRKRMLHKYLKISNKAGLTDALLEYGRSKKISLDYIQKFKNEAFTGSLFVLTGGSHIPNPSEILGSEIFKEYVSELKQYFDFIIIDCAPVGMISDAIPVGNAVDGTIFICSSQDTNKKEALNCVNLLRRNNVRLLGSVLTKANASSKNYYYSK